MIALLGACSAGEPVVVAADGERHRVDRWDVDEARLDTNREGTYAVELLLEPEALDELNAFISQHEGDRLSIHYRGQAILEGAPIMAGFSLPALYIPADDLATAEAIQDAFD